MGAVILVTVIFAITLGSMGCPSTSGRGVLYPPKPPNCPVDFVMINMQTPMGRQAYQQIGSVSLEDVPERFTPALKRRLRPLVCELGGEAVTYGMFSADTSGTRAEFYVLLRR
jgi:hypothetical protein